MGRKLVSLRGLSVGDFEAFRSVVFGYSMRLGSGMLGGYGYVCGLLRGAKLPLKLLVSEGELRCLAVVLDVASVWDDGGLGFGRVHGWFVLVQTVLAKQFGVKVYWDD